MKKIAMIFPGQGAQYPGMGQDFCKTYPLARQVFEEADDTLKRNLSKTIFEGPEEVLTQTHESQAAIFVVSLAILTVLQNLYPHLQPAMCGGLSLGEYTALTASGKISFAEALLIVEQRGRLMSEACEKTQGAMAVVMGLDGEVVESLVKELNLPNDLWVANFNCPGQVVISGTLKGIGLGSDEAKKRGAKRVLPLQVHGAFHSGLMRLAETELAPYIHQAPLKETAVRLAMNVPGQFVDSMTEIRSNLIRQVTNSVRWEQAVRAMANGGADLFIEIGCGKTLAGMNKRIGVSQPTVSVEKLEDVKALEEVL